jgi:hypothetical protein
MSIHALSWAFMQNPEHPHLKLVLLLLAEANPRDYYCIYQADELGEDACLSFEEVIDALDRLEGLDLLSWQWNGEETDRHLAVTLHLASPEERGVADQILDGFVYVFDGRDETGDHIWSKIGISRDVDRRLRATRMDSHGHWRLQGLWRMSMQDARKVEDRLKDHPLRNSASGAGWFATSAEEAVAGVIEVMRMLKIHAVAEGSSGRPH